MQTRSSVDNRGTLGMFSLEGRTVVLTGATGFLGRTLAEGLLGAGGRVVALGRSARLADLAAGWTARYGTSRVDHHQIDMNDLEALGSLLDRLAAEEATIDVVINNAHELGARSGFNTPEGSFERASLEQWTLNLTGGVVWPALVCQRLGDRLKEHGRGSVINIATMYAAVAPSPLLYEGTEKVNPPGYSAAKAGLVALTRYLASYWGRSGVRANAISPGPFSNTEFATENSVAPDDPFLARLADRTCLGRVGKARELTGAAVFLASDASSYITGHCLMVDGGWTAI